MGNKCSIKVAAVLVCLEQGVIQRPSHFKVKCLPAVRPGKQNNADQTRWLWLQEGRLAEALEWLLRIENRASANATAAVMLPRISKALADPAELPGGLSLLPFHPLMQLPVPRAL